MATAGLLTPRKKVTYGKPVLPTLKTPTAARAPTAPKPPAPFTPAAAPAPIVHPPPQPSYASQSDRLGAREGYGGTVADVNAQMRNLAANYGFAPSVTQFGWNPEGTTNAFGDTQTEAAVTPNAPGSTADVLLRNLQGQQRNIDETALAQNTFFSGRRLDDRGRADTDYGAQVAQAQRDFQEAIRTLTNSITQGRSSRDQTFRNADEADRAAAQAAPPEAQAAAPPPMNPYFPTLPLSTGFAGLDPNKRYRPDSKGRLMIQNANGSWRYV